MRKRTTISVTIQTMNKLNEIKHDLEQALSRHKIKLSPEDVIKILLTNERKEVYLDLMVGKGIR